MSHDKTVCEWCRKPSMVYQCHHIITKGSSGALRFESDNGIFLCKGCHYKVHNAGYLDFSVWFVKTFPGRFEKLKARKYNHFKNNVGNLELMEMSLKNELEELGR